MLGPQFEAAHRLGHEESVGLVKTARRMPCCVVWLAKRFLQWSATRSRDDCALRGTVVEQSVVFLSERDGHLNVNEVGKVSLEVLQSYSIFVF